MQSFSTSVVTKIQCSWKRLVLLDDGLAVGSKVKNQNSQTWQGCVMRGGLQVMVLIPLLFIIKDFSHDLIFYHESLFIPRQPYFLKP